MRISRHDLRRRYSNSLVIDAGSQFSLRACSQANLNVHRTVEGKLETDVYRKPTHTDKYLSYDSHHPVSHKRSVATNQKTHAVYSIPCGDCEKEYLGLKDLAKTL